LREAEGEEIVVTRNGKPAGVLIGFGSDDDWFDYRLAKRPTVPTPHRACPKELAQGAAPSASRMWRENAPNGTIE
jgi:antitoxin (DNA-binding transcriptional repressor) of toxin-antitoxin stability system